MISASRLSTLFPSVWALQWRRYRSVQEALRDNWSVAPCFWVLLALDCSLPSQSPDSIGPQDQTKGESCDEHLAKSADHERAQPLLGHFAEVRAQADSGKGEQERPSRQVGERQHLVLGESVEADQQREHEESEHELRELVPQERSFVADVSGLSALCPVDGVGENHEADHGIAGGLGQHSDFARRIGVEGASGR